MKNKTDYIYYIGYYDSYNEFWCVREHSNLEFMKEEIKHIKMLGNKELVIIEKKIITRRIKIEK